MKVSARISSAIFVATIVLAGLVTPVLSGSVYYADDPQFSYTGRWEVEERAARADWPCSGVQFSVASTAPTSLTTSLTLRLKLVRSRVHVLVTNAQGLVESTTILEGGAFRNSVKNFDVLLKNKKPGNYTVSLKKLSQASPFNNGLGKPLRSLVEFHGVQINDDADVHMQAPPPRPLRRVALIGASDTAGFCVDGTPETSDAFLQGWKYDNCDMTSHAVLGRRLDAEVSVQAIAGIGLTQNAFASRPYLLGKNTMPDYYDRVLQTEEGPSWNFAEWRPDLVVVSLGGNDFNHQHKVPSNATFSSAYEQFLDQITQPYLEDDSSPPTIVSVCGQGDPTEVERDPNNDRCRPCPHVKDATESFRTKHPNIRVEYVFVPCDGTVVTGKDDIGCEGHKNRLGQTRVADFLEPRLRQIMAWSRETDSDPIEFTMAWGSVSSWSSKSLVTATFVALFGLTALLAARRIIRSCLVYRKYVSVSAKVVDESECPVDKEEPV